MAIKVAINGMGVLGRKLFRAIFNTEGWEVVLLNDVNYKNVPSSALAYFLQHDSVYGNYSYNVTTIDGSDSIEVNGKTIFVSIESDYNQLPLGDMGVDVVFDCVGTGTKEKDVSFLTAGAKRVVIMSDFVAGNDLPTIVYSINKSSVTKDENIICVPSGKIIADSVLSYVVNDVAGYSVESAHFEDICSYTNANSVSDLLNVNALSTKFWQTSRAGAWNLIRSKNDVKQAIGLVVPELNGKCDDYEIKSGTIRGSVSYGTFLVDRWDKDSFDAAFKSVADETTVAVSDEGMLLVSSDIVGTPYVWYCYDVLQNYSDTKYLVTIPVIYDPIMVQIANAVATVKYWVSLG